MQVRLNHDVIWQSCICENSVSAHSFLYFREHNFKHSINETILSQRTKRKKDHTLLICFHKWMVECGISPTNRLPERHHGCDLQPAPSTCSYIYANSDIHLRVRVYVFPLKTHTRKQTFARAIFRII